MRDTRQEELKWPWHRLRRLVAVFASALAVACDDATGTRPVPVGTLSVELSGAVSGQYEARGAQPVPATPAPATFASAREVPLGDGRYLVIGLRARAGGRQDMLSLELTGARAPGSYAAAGRLVLGGAGEGALPEKVYSITEVNVRVTALSATSIAGEFSGVAVGGDFPSTFPNLPRDTVRFSAGTFDVPIIPR